MTVGLKLEPLDIANRDEFRRISTQRYNYFYNPCSSCACSWQCEQSGAFVGYCGQDTCYCGNPWLRGVVGNLLIDWNTEDRVHKKSYT